MSLAQGISSVVPVVFVIAALLMLGARRRALAAGREFSTARVVGYTALAGVCGAAVGVLALIALNATVLR